MLTIVFSDLSSVSCSLCKLAMWSRISPRLLIGLSMFWPNQEKYKLRPDSGSQRQKELVSLLFGLRCQRLLGLYSTWIFYDDPVWWIRPNMFWPNLEKYNDPPRDRRSQLSLRSLVNSGNSTVLQLLCCLLHHFLWHRFTSQRVVNITWCFQRFFTSTQWDQFAFAEEGRTEMMAGGGGQVFVSPPILFWGSFGAF